MYISDSIKGSERQLRGTGDKFIIHSEMTKKPADWKLFLCNDENKKQLSELLLSVWSSNELAEHLQHRYIIVVVEGKATELSSDDGHVTITEDSYLDINARGDRLTIHTIWCKWIYSC